MTTSIVRDSPFIRACLGQPVPRTPVWFMRQAGRSLPEYRAAREGIGMLDSCRRPDLVCELTLQPVRRPRLAAIAREFLRVQVGAGVAAVQLFDSWAGALSAADYREFVLPHSAAVLDGVAEVPRIHFGVGTGHLLPAMAEAGAEVVGVDWRTPLDEAAPLVGGRAVQGNLDPAALFAPWPAVEAQVRRILAEGRAATGHVFNLGHGVLPDTDPEVLTKVVALVHEVSAG